jgi:hypothetical protein
MDPSLLNDFAGDVYSQFGEDGIIAEILDRIEAVQPLTRWCVEFGAHDGVFMSNTCELVRSRGYRAVMIEVDPERARTLAETHPQPEVIKIASMVGLEGDSRLDRILASTPIPIEFDVLSIDIDGCDYWILDSIKEYRPSVILVEFNPTIPNAVEFVQARDLDVRQGSSPLSIYRLAQAKGYELVAVTHVNLMLVRRHLLETVIGPGVQPPTLEDLRDDSACITYAFAGYDGTLLFSTPTVHFPWHNVDVDTSRIQPIPKSWRFPLYDWPARSFRSMSWRLFQKFSRRLSEPGD